MRRGPAGKPASRQHRVECCLVATLHYQEVPPVLHELFDLSRIVRRIAARLLELFARREYGSDAGVERGLIAHATARGVGGNEGYPASLEKRKVYQEIPDPDAAKQNLIRVIDESGEDYLFPRELFLPIELSAEARDAILSRLVNPRLLASR
jgi:hypothetical protein